MQILQGTAELVFVGYYIYPSLVYISNYGEVANVMIAFKKTAPVSWKLQTDKSDCHTNDTVRKLWKGTELVDIK